MAMNAARSIALLLIAGLLTSPGDLASCGPFLLTAVFTLSRQPDKPDSDFARGQLGVLLQSFYRRYLAVAYRHLTGVGVSENERKAFFPMPPSPGPAPKWNPEWKTTVWPPVDEWLEARKKVPGAPAPSKIDIYRRDRDPNNYSEYVNCADDAFHTAAITLTARLPKLSTAEMQDWLHAQDDVFANCAAGPVIPQPAPVTSDALLKADRAYQIAAANFYAGNFDAAESQFRAIAADQDSPWRATSAYLLARCSIRRATLTDNSEAMAQAAQQLDNVLQNDSLKPVHPAAASLLTFVRARLNPERSLHELAQSILAKNASPALAQNFNDYLFLFYKRDGSLKPPDDLTDWLDTFRANSSLSDHTLERWRATRSLPWLVAALAEAHAGDAAVTELLQAADQIKPDSAAYLTIAFHTIRLLQDSKQNEEARGRLDPILASRSKYPVSAVNLFLAERTRMAESWETFLNYAPRVAVGSGYDYDVESDANLSSDPRLKAFVGRPIFDADVTKILNEQVPLARLKDAASDPSLPASLRSRVATAAWVRAVLLEDDALSAQLAPQIQALGLKAYLDAPDKDTRRFEAAYLILKNPGFRPFVETGFGRLTPISKIDDLHDNWWCSFNPQQGQDYLQNYYRSRSRLSAPLEMLYGARQPQETFLPEADRSLADKEWKALEALPAAPTWLSAQIVTYVKVHDSDPRVPEALALAVRSSRFGCGDSGTTQQSRAAFRLLHTRYPNSDWAKKTKYYY